jgi:hypothetical protein
MEFLALLTWLVLAGGATLLVPFAIATLGSALSVLATFTGVAAAVLFLVLDAPLWLAWAQAALALVGLLGIAVGALQLNDGERITGTVGEEIQASALGLQLPFYFVVLFLVLLLASGGVDPVI